MLLEDHEVLTPKGWKNAKSLTIGMKVTVAMPNRRDIQYVPIDGINRDTKVEKGISIRGDTVFITVSKLSKIVVKDGAKIYSTRMIGDDLPPLITALPSKPAKIRGESGIQNLVDMFKQSEDILDALAECNKPELLKFLHLLITDKAVTLNFSVLKRIQYLCFLNGISCYFKKYETVYYKFYYKDTALSHVTSKTNRRLKRRVPLTKLSYQSKKPLIVRQRGSIFFMEF